MLQVCGAVVRAPASSRKLLLQPDTITPSMAGAAEAQAATVRTSKGHRQRRGSITLSTGYQLLQKTKPVRSTTVRAASQVSAYMLASDDIAKMLINDIYGASIRFGAVPSRDGNLRMPGASTIGVVIDVGEILEKQIGAEDLKRLDKDRSKPGTELAGPDGAAPGGSAHSADANADAG